MINDFKANLGAVLCESTRLSDRRSPISRLINPCGEPEQTADRGDEVLMRLKHQEIEADLDIVSSEGLLTADAIIAEVRRLEADLLVLGAQAEGGIRQWFQNSVSRQVLADASIPLLIAN